MMVINDNYFVHLWGNPIYYPLIDIRLKTPYPQRKKWVMVMHYLCNFLCGKKCILREKKRKKNHVGGVLKSCQLLCLGHGGFVKFVTFFDKVFQHFRNWTF